MITHDKPQIRFLSLLLSLVVIFASLPVAMSVSADATKDGSSEDKAYEISTYQQLKDFLANQDGKTGQYAKLTADVTASNTDVTSTTFSIETTNHTASATALVTGTNGNVTTKNLDMNGKTINLNGQYGIVICSGSSLNIKSTNGNGNITGGRGTYQKGKSSGIPYENVYGGAIYNFYGYLNMDDTNIANCTATDCGGIYNCEGTATLTDVSITNCNSAVGGGIYNDYGTAMLNNVNIADCTAMNGGGGISNVGGTMSMTGGSIKKCTVSAGQGDISGGGGIFNGGIATLNNVNILDCKAGYTGQYYFGGGIFNILGIMSMTGGSIKNCTSAFAGGGICNYINLYKKSIATLTDITVTGCNAKSTGGGVLNLGTMALGGKTKIRKNHLTDSSTNSNLVVSCGEDNHTPITLTDNFSDNRKGSVGVTVRIDGFSAGTGNFVTDTDTEDDVEKKFISDEPDKYHIEAKNPNLAVADGASTFDIDKEATDTKQGSFEVSTTTDIPIGTTVTVIPKPNSGYTVDTVSYNDGFDDYTIEPVEGVYSFSMPAEYITMSVTFKKTGSGGGGDDPVPTDKEQLKKAQDAVELALSDLNATNDTTKEDVEKLVENALEDAKLKSTKFSVEDFQKDLATTENEGKLTANIKLTYGNATGNVALNKAIAKLEPTPTPTPTDTGWKKTDDGKWQYLDENGKAVTGWQNNIKGWEGQWFYFDNLGIMQTGWYNNIPGWNDKWFYFDRQTGVMHRGWAFVDDGHGDYSNKLWYYLDPETGAMQTDWQKIDGKWYYLDYNRNNWGGAMQTGWQLINDQWYCFASNGAMYENCTTPDGYVVNAQGVWAK